MYYYAELQNSASISRTEPLESTTLRGAKIAACKRQIFKGTVLHIYDEHGNLIAEKIKEWQDVEPWR